MNTLSRINRDIYYLVRCKELYNHLPSSKMKFLASDSLVGQIKEVNNYAKEIKADCVLLNGGSSIYFTPFINCGLKIIIDIQQIIVCLIYLKDVFMFFVAYLLCICESYCTCIVIFIK